MVVSCFARSPKAFDRMAGWPIYANELRATAADRFDPPPLAAPPRADVN
jgi:hypothetical protein